jgi:hypothetical protein
MTREKMIEKVALTIVGCNQGSWNCWTTEAGEIVDMVLEEAAQVCEGWRPTGGTQEYRKGYAAAADESADAIRALKG